MKTLSETWFAEGYIDFELKKYTLLAYLQQVTRYFNESKLYPQLSDVIFHYNNLQALKENKKFLQEQFPKKLSGVQIEKLQLLYEQIIEDDNIMRLMSFPNVLITSHQGFFTDEALTEIAKTTLQNVQDFEGGKPLANKVI